MWDMTLIATFSDKALKRFWHKGSAKGIDPISSDRLKRLLDALDGATKPEDMDVIGYGFNALEGDCAGQYAVTIRAQWRLVFEWKDGAPVKVHREDYHGC